jgi:nucleotide-binding universal stress UspA family protein
MPGFETIVCGVDSSPQGIEAVRQAEELGGEDAEVWGVGVWNPSLAVHAGIHANDVLRDLRDEVHANVRKAADEFPGMKPMVVRGSEVAGLIAAASNLEADVLAVGSHGSARMAGVILVIVATGVVHEAPCSVLIARRPESASAPKMVLHADDGSSDSRDAAAAAAAVAGRLGAAVTTLHVGSDWEATDRFGAGSSEVIEASGVETSVRRESGSAHREIITVAAEIDASLIVVGSRGKVGISALGSVSERVAHRAPCSVLVVRRGVHPREEAL